jgi:D-tyrosyl-tRNA(Tyr) deacylase
MMTQMLQKNKFTVEAINKSKQEHQSVQTQNMIDKLEKSIASLDKLFIDPKSVESVKRALMQSASTLKKANGQQVENQQLLEKKN